MRSPVFLLVVVAAAASCSTSSEIGTTTGVAGVPAEIVAVLDGDSVRALTEDGEVEVRLAGLNAPERDECHGDDARAALAQLLEGSAVTLVVPAGEDQDQFRRLLRYVYANESLVNHEMIAAGHALALQTGHPEEAAFKRAETEAFDAGAGMWARDACGPAPPSGLSIDRVEYDPPGRDAENADAERVTIRNTGDSPIDLSGWMLRDESTQHRFEFPGGTVLQPGDLLVVRSGCAPTRPLDLAWCAGDAVWSNGGDTALLTDQNGNVAARYTYEGDF